MFGDSSWLEQRELMQQAHLEASLARVGRPVVVELGAGSYIASVRHFVHEVIHRYGGWLVRINPLESDVPAMLDVGLPVGALECVRRGWIEPFVNALPTPN